MTRHDVHLDIYLNVHLNQGSGLATVWPPSTLAVIGGHDARRALR